ncbi:BQ5605_C018g08685 [Microbotryum silenes-dioicae]|uniref:BQ5605_C018g08685 protein n=1 Tax=Microbotryum silenes-dioicae TaxID=796604 RepID=A0A2X0P089_9BASI|nr:BQ5605_C018g08685 [Microbotryum silenes-dioicae]
MSWKAAERRGVKPEAEGHVPGCFDGKWNLGERGRNGLLPHTQNSLLRDTESHVLFNGTSANVGETV